MINTALKNIEALLAQSFKALMSKFMGQHDHNIKITDAIVNIEQCAAFSDDLDEDKQNRRKSSRSRRKNKDRRISNGINYSGHSRRLTIDRRQLFTDRRGKA